MVWELSSEHKLHSNDLDQHLACLVGIILPLAEQIESLRSEGALTDVFCLWMSERQGGPTVDWQQLRDLGALKLPLSFDVYFPDDRP